MTAKSSTICHIYTDLIRVFVYPVLVFIVGLPRMLDKKLERRYYLTNFVFLAPLAGKSGVTPTIPPTYDK